MTRPIKMTKRDQLTGWLRHAEAGSRIVYHEGFLVVDRMLDDDLDWRATVLLKAAENFGSVELTQKRVGPNHYRYIATRKGNLNRDRY